MEHKNARPAPKPLQTIQIDQTTYSLEDQDMVRALLFVGTEQALLVDSTTGAGGSVRAAVEQITDKPVILVNTHTDGDHTGMNHEFDVAYMHPAEMSRYHQGQMPGQDGNHNPVEALWEGDLIDIGGRVFEVVLIPGHTDGSIALLDRDNRVILTGDTLSAATIFMFGPGRDLPAYRMSLEKLQALSDAFDTVYPAHGPCPLPASCIAGHIRAAAQLAAGELEPQEPPFPLPAKLFVGDGASFFYE